MSLVIIKDSMTRRHYQSQTKSKKSRKTKAFNDNLAHFIGLFRTDGQETVRQFIDTLIYRSLRHSFVFPKAETLAAFLGCSTRHVRRLCQAAEEFKLIKRHYRGYATNCYLVNHNFINKQNPYLMSLFPALRSLSILCLLSVQIGFSALDVHLNRNTYFEQASSEAVMCPWCRNWMKFCDCKSLETSFPQRGRMRDVLEQTESPLSASETGNKALAHRASEGQAHEEAMCSLILKGFVMYQEVRAICKNLSEFTRYEDGYLLSPTLKQRMAKKDRFWDQLSTEDKRKILVEFPFYARIVGLVHQEKYWQQLHDIQTPQDL